MKKRSIFMLVISFIIISIMLMGCTQQSGSQESLNNKDTEVEQKIVVYTSIYPLYNFTERIAGEHAEVINLIPAGLDPHDFEPSPAQIMKLSNADLFIYNGGGFEGWIERLVEAAANPKMKVVNSTEKISLLSNEETGHSHGEEDEHHEHEDQDVHEDHDHGALDSHVWLDPLLAKEQAKAIKEALVELDPQHKEIFEANYQQLEQEFEQIHQQFMDLNEHIERRNFVVSHAAFGYLALRYDLNQVAITGVNPSDEPSAKQLQQLIRFVKDNKIQYIMFENSVTPKVAEVVKEDVGAEVLIIHNLEGLSEEELSQGKDYFSIMGDNLTALKIALGYQK